MITWRRVDYLLLSPRAYFTHSVFRTGLKRRYVVGSRCPSFWMWWSNRLTYPARRWAFRHLVIPSRLARRFLPVRLPG
jgi:hypothetical protein